jgi:hypothetical protein
MGREEIQVLENPGGGSQGVICASFAIRPAARIAIRSSVDRREMQGGVGMRRGVLDWPVSSQTAVILVCKTPGAVNSIVLSSTSRELYNIYLVTWVVNQL